jgi:hypothetical protein
MNNNIFKILKLKILKNEDFGQKIINYLNYIIFYNIDIVNVSYLFNIKINTILFINNNLINIIK